MQTEKNMAGPYEIIVLDLDGTLTNRDKVVTPRTKAALMKPFCPLSKSWRKAGCW